MKKTLGKTTVAVVTGVHQAAVDASTLPLANELAEGGQPPTPSA
jgi:hypothetical protein